MPWISLGTVTPIKQDWRSLDEPSITDELFLIQQSWNGEWPGSGHLELSAYYADGGRYGFQRIGIDPNPRIISFPVPQFLYDAGFTVRYLAVRQNLYSRIQSTANWQVELKFWTPITDPNGEGIQLVDGGEY